MCEITKTHFSHCTLTLIQPESLGLGIGLVIDMEEIFNPRILSVFPKITTCPREAAISWSSDNCIRPMGKQYCDTWIIKI